jgi:nucleoside-diphosphate-sugar epimerase
MTCFINKICTENGLEGRKNIFITGATGILGSQVFYELLPLFVSGTIQGKIVLLVRPVRNITSKQRVENILTHPDAPEKVKELSFSELMKHIIIIDAGLNDFMPVMLPEGIKNYTVIHAAASVNLGQNESSGKEIEDNNYKGTMNILYSMTPFMKQFVYISTAFSSGHRKGEIDDDFLSVKECNFRNPYEQFKHLTEVFVDSYCTSKGIEWKILRPSIICGRLVEAPFYAISRFLVFYLFPRYVIAFRKRLTKFELRLSVPERSDINIVPVDYVSKAVVASLQTPVQQLNIVHPRNVSCRELFRSGFSRINFENYSFRETVPEDLSPSEHIFYDTIGQQLNPYINTPAYHFNTESLDKTVPGIKLPNIEEHFGRLLDYAIEHNFNSSF